MPAGQAVHGVLEAPASLNVPAARVFVCDGWPADGPLQRRRLDAVVSNPPVHAGVPDDLRVLRGLVDEAALHLRPGGCLWVVTQTQVPTGLLLRASKLYARVSASPSADGRFIVWRARTARGLPDVAASPAAAVDGSSASTRKRKRLL